MKRPFSIPPRRGKGGFSDAAQGSFRKPKRGGLNHLDAPKIPFMINQQLQNDPPFFFQSPGRPRINGVLPDR